MQTLKRKQSIDFATLLLKIVVIFIYLSSQANSFTSGSTCTATNNKYYNYIIHQCETCPSSTNTSKDNSYCNCSSSNYPNPLSIGFKHSTSCLPGTGSITANSHVFLLYNRDGSQKTSKNVQSCHQNSYPNDAKTQCIPCGHRMKYDYTLKQCVCNQTNNYPVNGFCTPNTTANPFLSNEAENLLLFGIASAGCNPTNPSKQACQILLNKCAQNNYRAGDNFCRQLATKINIINSQYSLGSLGNQTLGIYASSVLGTDTTDVKNKLTFIVFQYNKFGELRDIKPFGPELLPCIATQQDSIHFQSFGLNLAKSCAAADLKPTQSIYYDIYVLNSDLNYVQVYTLYATSTYYKRYFYNGYKTIQMTFKSTPPLSVPYINFNNNQPPQIKTSSKTDVVNLAVLAPFIIFNVGILIIFIINFGKYIKYNPNDNNDPYFCFKAILIFFLIAIRHWGIALWIFIFGVSTYCFCFYKFQQTVFLLLPDVATQWLAYYEPFMIVFYIQFGFVFLSVGLLIYDMGATVDYFMIDWQKQKNVSNYDIHIGKNKRQISVWRKVLLVNQLYELTISQLINIPFVVVFGIFFLQGLKWINLSYEIPNLNDVNKDYSTTSTRNVVLSYFLITFIFFIIALIKYVIRFLVKTWNPMPYEDFVDLCCISNISLIIFDHDLHGYYIHGMNPLGKAQGTLGYIDSIFQKQAKAFGKSRAFRNDDPQQTQTFQVCFPTQIRQAFQMKYKNRYLQKLVGKTYDTSIFAKPIPDMLDDNDYKQIENIQNDMLQSFKYYLQGVKTTKFNVRQRTFLQNLVSCPIDKDQMGRLPIFFKDNWHEYTKVLLSGHEFLILINTINFINIFYIATNSVVIACLITMVICRIFIKKIAQMVIRRNISKNTLIDDKFFS